VQLSADDVTNGRLADELLREALRQLRDTGLVVLEGVYARDWVARLRVAYEEELQRHIAARGGLDAINAKSFGKNHLGLHLPLVPPFSDPAIVANPIAVQVMSAALGDDLRCSFYHSNTAYPGSAYQPIHRDVPPLFGAELSVPTPVVHVVLNVPLCDFTLENGSTEVWPGSHLIVDTAQGEGRGDVLAQRVEGWPAMRTNIPAGSIVIRDLRMWHRGMPNNSHEARTMLAIVYQRGWSDVPKLLEIPRATWDAWPEPARHIFRHNTVVDIPTPVAHPEHAQTMPKR